jgi:hypothetical protein
MLCILSPFAYTSLSVGILVVRPLLSEPYVGEVLADKGALPNRDFAALTAAFLTAIYCGEVAVVTTISATGTPGVIFVRTAVRAVFSHDDLATHLALIWANFNSHSSSSFLDNVLIPKKGLLKPLCFVMHKVVLAKSTWAWGLSSA